MSNPTTPFGWQMPTATDLVTDLPADFEVFGQAVATSMADLLGGTTNQILAKNSNTDMDFKWITNDVGDITEVTAGTGISGGGTSGAVTITNSMATAITTAGDTLYGTGSGTFSRLGIGTAGQVLKVNSGATAPEWGSASAPFAGVALTKSAVQSIPGTTYTSLTFDTEDFDTDAYHSTATNTSRITIPSGKAGYYLVTANTSTSSGSQFAVHTIVKNGSIYKQSFPGLATANGYAASTLVVIMNLAVSDYIETSVYTTGTINMESNAQGPRNTFFSAYYLGA
jgi:hypothetical protein